MGRWGRGGNRTSDRSRTCRKRRERERGEGEREGRDRDRQDRPECGRPCRKQKPEGQTGKETDKAEPD